MKIYNIKEYLLACKELHCNNSLKHHRRRKLVNECNSFFYGLKTSERNETNKLWDKIKEYNQIDFEKYIDLLAFI